MTETVIPLTARAFFRHRRKAARQPLPPHPLAARGGVLMAACDTAKAAIADVVTADGKGGGGVTAEDGDEYEIFDDYLEVRSFHSAALLIR